MVACHSKFYPGVYISSSILKKLLPVIILIGFAAAWGYFADQAKNESKPAAVVKVEEQAPKELKPLEVQPIPEPKQTNFSPPPVAAPSEPPPALPDNPYEQFMKAVEPNNNLSDSLNSLNSGALKDEQVIRRNEYFEKLSQQLKELQGNGGGPPPELEQKAEGEPQLIEDQADQQVVEEQPLSNAEQPGTITDEPEQVPEEEIPDFELPPDENANIQ